MNVDDHQGRHETKDANEDSPGKFNETNRKSVLNLELEESGQHGDALGNRMISVPNSVLSRLYLKIMCDRRILSLFYATHFYNVFFPAVFEADSTDDDSVWLFSKSGDEEDEYVDTDLMTKIMSMCGVPGDGQTTALYDMLSSRMDVRLKYYRYVRRSRNLFRFMFLRQKTNQVQRMILQTIVAHRTQTEGDAYTGPTCDDEMQAAHLAQCYLDNVNNEMRALVNHYSRSTHDQRWTHLLADDQKWADFLQSRGDLATVWSTIKYSCFNKNDHAFTQHLVRRLDPHNVLVNTSNVSISYTGRFFNELRMCFKVFDVSDDDVQHYMSANMFTVLDFVTRFTTACRPVAKLTLAILQCVRNKRVPRRLDYHEADVAPFLDKYLDVLVHGCEDFVGQITQELERGDHAAASSAAAPATPYAAPYAALSAAPSAVFDVVSNARRQWRNALLVMREPSHSMQTMYAAIQSAAMLYFMMPGEITEKIAEGVMKAALEHEDSYIVVFSAISAVCIISAKQQICGDVLKSMVCIIMRASMKMPQRSMVVTPLETATEAVSQDTGANGFLDKLVEQFEIMIDLGKEIPEEVAPFTPEHLRGMACVIKSVLTACRMSSNQRSSEFAVRTMKMATRSARKKSDKVTVMNAARAITNHVVETTELVVDEALIPAL